MSDAGHEWSDVPDDRLERLDAHEQTRIGRYVLCRRLADGGMGTVYLAKAEGPGGFERALAIKRIHPHLARRKDLVDMFLDEARLSARIHHPNVCQTFDFGEADGTWFLAMEYLLGESLASVVRQVGIDPDLLAAERWRAIVARLIADSAEGLHAAHELTDDRGAPLGVVHRDVSPQNLFVTYDGAVKVLDFGVARAAGRIHQTRAGALKGKVSYMSPEQVNGADVDRRSDVFALGVCLWEALTSKRLFKRETDIATIAAVKDHDVPDPSSVQPGIEPELDRIVARALAQDPADRFANARELAAQLEGYLHTRSRATARATVATLMTELFESRQREKAEIVRTELAAAVEPSHSGVIEAPKPREGTASMAGPPRASPSSPPRAGELTPSFSPGPATPSVPKLAEAAPRRQSRTPIYAAIAAVVVLAAGGVGLALWPADEPAAHVVLPTEPATAPATEPVPTPQAEPEPEPEPAPEPASVSTSVSDETSPTPRRRRTRRRVVPAAPAQPAEPGRVNVVTPGGWADVYLGARLLGRTPRSVQLPAGDHVLELRPFGRTPGQRVQVQVRAGGVERVVRQVTQ